ncbi:MAG: hypothetical protein CMJ58_06035 [Planctomycetaceae bacterium]|nr:hypothetical protein [Planctomycetaceae bacterium]
MDNWNGCLLQAGCVVLLATAAGCSDGRVPVYPVTGTVLVDGRPAVGAEVICYARNEELKRSGVPIPTGVVDDSGEFVLDSYGQGDGAPAGEYDLSVIWNVTVVDSDDPESRVERDQLAGRYEDPKSSGLNRVVNGGPTTWETLELRSRPAR